MSKRIYTPNRWILIRLKNSSREVTKVLGGWSGGYLDSDSWKLSSGIKSVEDFEDFYLVKNYSGSIYKCYKKNEGVTILTGNILEKIRENVDVELVDINEFLNDR